MTWCLLDKLFGKMFELLSHGIRGPGGKGMPLMAASPAVLCRSRANSPRATILSVRGYRVPWIKAGFMPGSMLSDTSGWLEARAIMTITEEIRSLFAGRGAGAYFGESVSMTEHGLQAAYFAQVAAAPP
jgi:hypothetical protein